MKTKKRITALRILAYIGACVIPLLAIFSSILLVCFADIVMNSTFIITFLILPIITILGFALLLFSHKAIGIKIALTAAMLIAFVTLLFILIVFGKYEILSCYKNEEIPDVYVEIEKEFDPMPSLDEIGQPIKTEYYDYFSTMGYYFSCDTDTLICQYSDADYEKQKKLLDEAYVFQTQTITSRRDKCDSTVEIDGYVFRMLSTTDVYGKEIDYPKRLIFIATNDHTNEIVYMAFYESELDYIDSLTDVINKDCGWKHIR